MESQTVIKNLQLCNIALLSTFDLKIKKLQDHHILIFLLAVGGATTGNIMLGIKGNGIELDGQNIWIYWLLIALLLIPIGWRFSRWVGKRLCCWLHKVGFVKPLCKIFNNLNG